MIKPTFLTDKEILELRLGFKNKHKRSISIQSRSYLASFYDFFSFKSCVSSSQLD